MAPAAFTTGVETTERRAATGAPTDIDCVSATHEAVCAGAIALDAVAAPCGAVARRSLKSTQRVDHRVSDIAHPGQVDALAR
jgi:hypothetical protein